MGSEEIRGKRVAIVRRTALHSPWDASTVRAPGLWGANDPREGDGALAWHTEVCGDGSQRVPGTPSSSD